jgi:hypothetical protein
VNTVATLHRLPAPTLLTRSGRLPEVRMIQTRSRAYEIRSVYIALAIKRAIERAKGGG